MCQRCDRGWVDFPAKLMGWVRIPEWDTDTDEAYVSPGGCRDMHPKGDGELIVSTLCNCARAERNYPPMPVAMERALIWGNLGEKKAQPVSRPGF